MRIAIIGCMVMNREISRLVSESRNTVRVWWLRQGLHDTPDILRTELQRALDEIERENSLLPENLRFEAVVLAYGLCSNGVLGLRSRRGAGGMRVDNAADLCKRPVEIRVRRRV